MCGRFTRKFSWAQVHAMGLGMPWEHLEPVQIEPSYNLAPSQFSPVIRPTDHGTLELVNLKWGLVPSWAKDEKIGYRMINAHGETAATKPAFRSAFKRRRCLVPVSGFYEWQKIEGQKTKQPWFIHGADRDLLLFAGLWERWNHGDEPLETFTILTIAPNDLMARLHDRMPVILEQADVWRWLDPSHADVHDLVATADEDVLAAHPVSTRVGSPKNNDALLIEPVEV